MDTKSWLDDVYVSFYRIARTDSERYRLYFDPRGWSKKQIKMFFEDLKYGDNEVWEKCLRIYPNRHHTSEVWRTEAEARFNSWCSTKKIR
jgi:hypothetical protein